MISFYWGLYVSFYLVFYTSYFRFGSYFGVVVLTVLSDLEVAQSHTHLFCLSP